MIIAPIRYLTGLDVDYRKWKLDKDVLAQAYSVALQLCCNWRKLMLLLSLTNNCLGSKKPNVSMRSYFVHPEVNLMHVTNWSIMAVLNVNTLTLIKNTIDVVQISYSLSNKVRTVGSCE